MRVDLTDTQRQLRDAVRDFAERRVRPVAADLDRTGRFPRDIVAELGRLGVLGCCIPEVWGGAGLDAVAYVLALEELARVSAATAAIVATHASLAAWPLLAFGSDEQRARYLPALAGGERLGGWGFAERAHPEEMPSIVATPDAEQYVLDGRCASVLNAPEARLAIVFAALEAKPDTDFLAAFLVETDQPGWRVVRLEERIGLHGAPGAEVVLTHVRVARANRLGGDTAGGAIARQTLEAAGPGVAAQSGTPLKSSPAKSRPVNTEQHSFNFIGAISTCFKCPCLLPQPDPHPVLQDGCRHGTYTGAARARGRACWLPRRHPPAPGHRRTAQGVLEAQTHAKRTQRGQAPSALEAAGRQRGHPQACAPRVPGRGVPARGRGQAAPALRRLPQTLHTALREAARLGEVVHALVPGSTQRRAHAQAAGPTSHGGRCAEACLHSWPHTVRQRT